MQETTSSSRSRYFQPLIRYFVAGLFTVLPLLITVVAISWAIGFLAGLVGPKTFLGSLLSDLGLTFVTDTRFAYLAGLIGLAIAVLALGVAVESGMRGLVHRVTNAILRRVPLVGKVYDTSQQLVSMLDAGGDDKLKGMSVVYCTFGEKGGVGVLALLPTKDKVTIAGKEFYVVLVPQSPVPIGGGLLFMPCDAVEHCELSVDALMSIYVSMGVVAPANMNKAAQQGGLGATKDVLNDHG